MPHIYVLFPPPSVDLFKLMASKNGRQNLVLNNLCSNWQQQNPILTFADDERVSASLIYVPAGCAPRQKARHFFFGGGGDLVPPDESRIGERRTYGMWSVGDSAIDTPELFSSRHSFCNPILMRKIDVFLEVDEEIPFTFLHKLAHRSVK
jgi:hypothetical protein